MTRESARSRSVEAGANHDRTRGLPAAAEILPGARGSRARDRAPLTVVGIGASAGGLKALQLFFETVPVDSGMAYVVIMHLDPERESRIGPLLQDRASIPVTQVTRTTRVRANHGYVIPPGRDLVMKGASIQLLKRGAPPPHSPVDLFFRTLADVCGVDAIGIVLSGTGTDGTSGIRRIKEHGGITVSQTPAEAEHAGMPGSAIETGQVDLVLPVKGIMAELLRLRRSPVLDDAEASEVETEARLAPVFASLRGKTGYDFSSYKRPVVLRRLERRLRFNGLESLDDYLLLLRDSAKEGRALVRDLLISVSGFFRDAAAFEALSELVPTLYSGKGPDDAVRVWVAGCATGEEAYSIAILLSEHAATLERPPRIQIFATDVGESGYTRGREALYPLSAVADIAPDRLQRFFTRETGGYRVKKELREGVLFAMHDVLHDPPFARLDLISCRNLLIYLQPEAQVRVLETFHFALQPAGLLFLGAAEKVDEDGMFAPIAERWRIYRRA